MKKRKHLCDGALPLSSYPRKELQKKEESERRANERTNEDDGSIRNRPSPSAVVGGCSVVCSGVDTPAPACTLVEEKRTDTNEISSPHLFLLFALRFIVVYFLSIFVVSVSLLSFNCV
eukprot:Hpha_TRINITY_DN16515_c0_g1::TRINITY_DN16515_c0_g1_i1::g.133819::m.133819